MLLFTALPPRDVRRMAPINSFELFPSRPVTKVGRITSTTAPADGARLMRIARTMGAVPWFGFYAEFGGDWHQRDHGDALCSGYPKLGGRPLAICGAT